MPGQPGPSTDGHGPGRRVDRAQLEDRLPGRFHREALPALAIQEEVEADAAAAADVPISRRVPSSAITVTLSRVRGRMSPTLQPEAVEMSSTVSSLVRLTMTCRTRESAARAAASTDLSRSSLRPRSATRGDSVSA